MAAIDAINKLIKESLDRVEVLEKRVARLEMALKSLESINWDGNEPMRKWMDRCDTIISFALNDVEITDEIDNSRG